MPVLPCSRCLFLTAAVTMAASTFVLNSAAQTTDAVRPLKRLIADYGYWSRTQTPPYSSAQIPFRELTLSQSDAKVLRGASADFLQAPYRHSTVAATSSYAIVARRHGNQRAQNASALREFLESSLQRRP